MTRTGMMIGSAGFMAPEQVTGRASATGSAWTSVQVSGLSGGGAHQIAALVSSGTAVTGIGLTATPQGQQPVVVSLAAG